MLLPFRKKKRMLKDYTAYGVIAAGDGQTLVGTLQQSRGQTLPMNMAHTVHTQQHAPYAQYKSLKPGEPFM